MTLPKLYELVEIKEETAKAKTLFFKGKIGYLPGQFVMLWLPGVDEKPFAVSSIDDDRFGITIEVKGDFTKKIHELKTGMKLGIRGPFGNGFNITGKAIIVAGGLGMAPARELIKKLSNSVIIQGARSKEHLLYLNKAEMMKFIGDNQIEYCTDDGSFGEKAFVTKLLEDELKKEDIKTVFCCGPEAMILKVFELCEKYKVECQASLERFMKCGIGLCGSCCIDDQLVCKDGPVFDSEKIRKLTELGKFARLKSGRKVKIEKYYKVN